VVPREQAILTGQGDFIVEDLFDKLGRELFETGHLDVAGEPALKDLPNDRLSDLLVYLAAQGGTGWIAPLVQMGADINHVNDEGGTALSNCVHARCEENPPKVDTFFTAIELLALGADPNSPYLSLFSVTHLAMQVDQPDFVVLFLLAGADPDAEEPDSQSSKTLGDNLRLGVEDATSPAGWPAQLLALRDRRRRI
jgi:hypothetical protein